MDSEVLTSPENGENGSLQVAAIGSCRVFTPLREAVGNGRIHAFRSLFPFVHNPDEVRQAVDLLRGKRKAPPEHIAALFNITQVKRFDGRDHFSFSLVGADVVVIELSSIRLVYLYGWSLQIHRVRQCLRAAGLSGDEIASFIADADAYRAGGGKIPNGIEHPAAHQLASDGLTREMNEAEIDKTIRDICDAVPTPILLVGFFEKKEDGEAIRQRVLLNGRMRAFVEHMCGRTNRNNVGFYDPTTLTDKHGFEVAVKDLGHYKDSFHATVGDALAAEIEKLTGKPRRRDDDWHGPPAPGLSVEQKRDWRRRQKREQAHLLKGGNGH